jgi:CDGSH-type Zn-finger protein
MLESNMFCLAGEAAGYPTGDMSEERVVITPYRDGPLLVRGPVQLCDQDGAVIATDRDVIALCRCGRSRIRPFCDGTHHLIRFRAGSAAEDRAAPEADMAPGSEVPRDTGPAHP